MDTVKIENIRETLLRSFAEIRTGVSDTTREFSRFIEMMDPYIEYFFSGGHEKDTFIGDVVVPSEENLTKAIKSASAIMNSDSTTHDTVYDSLVKVLSIQDSVAHIVAMLELIETYSLNTIIMSAKAGEEGSALAAISTEMAKMSQSGNSLSMNITGKMENLVASLGTFSDMRDRIETLHENNLTTIKLSSDSLFRGMQNEFTRLSGEVLSDYGMVSTVNETLKKVTEKFQHEDIVRQNLEKIIFAAKENGSGTFKGETSSGSSEPGIFLKLASIKLREMGSDIGVLHSEMSKALDDVSSVVKVFSDTLCSEKSGDGRCRGSDMLAELFDRLEKLKQQFEKYIESTIKTKQQMLDFLRGIESEIKEFGAFFRVMLDISRKFKTVILLTMIELSRHDSLRSLLGGALSDVRRIPDQINSVVSEGQNRYLELLATFTRSIEMYGTSFEEQKEVLETSIKLIRKVSVQIYESKKYHDDFVSESEKKIAEVEGLVNSVSGHLDVFSENGKILESEAGGAGDLTRTRLIEESLDLLKKISDHFSAKEHAGDYRSMMLASLASEYMSAHSAAGSVDFF
jgi:hypothetical protein